MINAWSKSAKNQIIDKAEFEKIEIDMGVYGHAKFFFAEDGCICVCDKSNTNLTSEEIEQVIDFAIGNLFEHECFWYEDGLISEEDLIDEPVDIQDYYERFTH